MCGQLPVSLLYGYKALYTVKNKVCMHTTLMVCLYSTVGVLVTFIKMISTSAPTVPYNKPLVWYAKFIFTVFIVMHG